MSTPEDPDQAARAPKVDDGWSLWAELPPGAAVAPKSPIARSVWAPEPVRGTGDAEVARVSEAQRGCIHRVQLLAAGVTRHSVAHRRQTHRLHHLHCDVYLVGRPRLEPLGLETAAVLHFAGHAILSHRTAAWIWGLIDEPPDEVTVTCVGRDRHSKPGLQVRRVASLSQDDVACCRGLPVTSPARTAVDVAGGMRPIELEGVLALIARRGLASVAEIEAAVARAPHRTGVGVLRELLGAPGELARTRSRYERRLLALIRDAGLPRPRVNTKVGGLEVDFLWPEQRLIVEFDGFAFHADRRAFELDRARDRRLAQLGHQVVRLTARGIDRTPLATVAELAALLAIRAAAAA